MNKHLYIIAASLMAFLVILIIVIKKQELKPLYIIFIGAGLVVVAGVITAWGTLLQNDASSAKTDLIRDTGNKTFSNSEQQLKEIEILKDQNDSLKSDLAERDNKIAGQSEKIIQLSEKLVEKSEYISDHLTGGKGYPLIVINTLAPQKIADPIRHNFEIKNEGSLPLYDIIINIFDWDYLQAKFIDSGDSNKPILKRSDFAKSQVAVLNESQMPANSSIVDPDVFEFKNNLLYLKLKSRSTFLFEKMAFVENKGVIYKAFVVYNKEGEVIQEWFQENAPELIVEEMKRKFDTIPVSVNWTLVQ